MTEASSAIALASIALTITLGWLSIGASQCENSSPNRLIAELRVAQLAALLLVLSAGIYIGIAIAYETQIGTGLDIAISVGFFTVAAIATTKDPRLGLTVLSLAFGVHALIDLLHRSNSLPNDTIPSWYLTGCAIHDVLVGGLCYLPVLRR